MVRNAVEGDFASGAYKVETTALTILCFKWQLPIPQSQIDLNSNLYSKIQVILIA
jgi:hypothetical protein